MNNQSRNKLVDKGIIVERSETYGNNFPLFAKLLKSFFKTKFKVQIDITPEDSAFMLCLLKVSRLSNNPKDEDTMVDLINYSWLGVAYDQYVTLLNKRKEDTERLKENLPK